MSGGTPSSLRQTSPLRIPESPSTIESTVRIPGAGPGDATLWSGIPLVLTDPGSVLPEDPARDGALMAAATQLVADLAAPGLAPDDPAYLPHWKRTVELSNQLLRQRFGGQVWMAHHIQSHHLARSSSGNMR